METRKIEFVMIVGNAKDYVQGIAHILQSSLQNRHELSHMNVLTSVNMEQAGMIFNERRTDVRLIIAVECTNPFMRPVEPPPALTDTVPFVESARQEGWGGPMIVSATVPSRLAKLITAAGNGCPMIATSVVRLIPNFGVDVLLNHEKVTS